MISCILLLVRNELLCVLVSADHVVIDEVNQSDSVGSVLELEVKAVAPSLLLDLDAFLLCVMLEYELFQEQKCPLVLNLLPHLNLRLPEMRSVCFLAVVALEVSNHEIYDKSLLEICSALNFFLDGDSDLQSLAMRLCPDEGGID